MNPFKKKTFAFQVFALTLGLFIIIQAGYTQQITNLSDKFTDNSPSIVRIYTQTTGSGTFGLGSGCIISSDGIIISNFHVLDGKNEAFVLLSSGEKYNVIKVLDYNKEYDLIIFKIDSKKPLPFLDISNELTPIGESVFAIGYPNGFKLKGSSTLSTGIISSHREVAGVQYLQTTTPITHGSSGGGLFNSEGQLCGITTGTFASSMDDLHANLNKVVPAKNINDLKRDLDYTLYEFYQKNIETSYFAQAMVYYEQLNWAEANKYFTMHLAEAPYDALAWFRSGMCYYFLGREIGDGLDEAELCFLLSIQLDNTNHFSQGQLAKLYLYQGKAAMAKPYVENCEALAPEDPFTWYVIASYYGNENVANYDKSLTYYDKLIDYKLKHQELSRIGNMYYERGITKFAEELYTKGLQDIDIALSYDPKCTICLWQKFVVLINNNRKNEACEVLDKLFAIDPNGTYQGESLSHWKKASCSNNNTNNVDASQPYIRMYTKDKHGYAVAYNGRIIGTIKDGEPFKLNQGLLSGRIYFFILYKLNRKGVIKQNRWRKIKVEILNEGTSVSIDGNSVSYSWR